MSLHPDGVDEAEALAQIREQHAEARARARVGLNPDRNFDLDQESARSIIIGYRAMPRDAVHNAHAVPLRNLALFNDLDCEASVRLVLTDADMIRLVRDVPSREIGPRYAASHLKFDAYDLIVGAADARAMVELSEAAQPLYNQIEVAGGAPILIMHHLFGRPLVQFQGALVVISRRSLPGSVAAFSFRQAGALPAAPLDHNGEEASQRS